jgi:DNA-binding response OmpR family regulator
MSRILIVEDEPAIALGLEDDLKMEGYQVEVAADGITGARRAREGGFDLILLDGCCWERWSRSAENRGERGRRRRS